MAFYNTYRPSTFNDVCGQEFVKKILSNQIKTGKLSNVYLFTGGAGTGKTTVARIFASMVNAKDGMTQTPDMNDPYVAQIMSGKGDSDVLEFDAATNGGIEEIRDMKEKAAYVPMQMRKKIWIIDECHRLTSAAWEGLLKLFEEPPAHAIFILCTTDADKVTETVITRSMCLRFKSVTPTDIFNTLKTIAGKEKIDITDEALKLITNASRGSLRLAISNLEKAANIGEKIDEKACMACVGFASQTLVHKFMQSITDIDFTEGMKNSSEIVGSGVDVKEFMEEVANLLHCMLICKRTDLQDTGLSKEEALAIRALRDHFSAKRKQIEEKTKTATRDEMTIITNMIKTLDGMYKYTVFNMQPQYLANLTWINLYKDYSITKG